MLKKILLISFSIVDLLLLYYGICHIAAGINAPVLVGPSGNAYFMGLHIMGFVFIGLFAVLTITIIMIALYMKPKGKKNENC